MCYIHPNSLVLTRRQSAKHMIAQELSLKHIYSISREKYAHGFCFAVLCCGYTLTDFPYPPGLLHWHCGNLTIAPVPAKQPWWIWINTSYEFIMNDCITTTKQSTTKPCAYFLGCTVCLQYQTITKHTNARKLYIFLWRVWLKLLGSISLW